MALNCFLEPSRLGRHRHEDDQCRVTQERTARASSTIDFLRSALSSTSWAVSSLLLILRLLQVLAAASYRGEAATSLEMHPPVMGRRRCLVPGPQHLGRRYTLASPILAALVFHQT